MGGGEGRRGGGEGGGGGGGRRATKKTMDIYEKSAYFTQPTDIEYQVMIHILTIELFSHYVSSI